MAVTVKKITLWRTQVPDKAGALAELLEPVAEAGTDLKVVMGYRIPGQTSQAVVEVFPIAGKRATSAAQGRGLTSATTPTLLVEGDNRPGLGHAFARAIADAGINMTFLVAQVVGRRYSSIFGFDSESDAAKAAGLIKKAAAARKPARTSR